VGIQGLFLTKNLERIGDHVTNIAENLYYIHAGKVLPNDRPKSDVTSFMLDEKELTL
jgi:Phosphate uptake regulator